MFKGMFGGGKKVQQKASASAAAKTIDSIAKLTEQEVQLEKRKALLEKKAQAEQDKVKECLQKKNQKQAMVFLKKKKMYESQIEQVDNMVLRISEQRMMIESSRTTADMLSTMQGAAQAAKQTLKEVNIDNVDNLMDEINDQNEEMRQVQDALGQPVGMALDMDDDELADELRDLEEAVLDEQLLEPAAIPTSKVNVEALPNPSTKVVNQKQKTPEEIELEQLEKEMGLIAA